MVGGVLIGIAAALSVRVLSREGSRFDRIATRIL